MRILLDTHIALWAILNDKLLPIKARDLIIDPDNTIFYSSVSTWEVLLKHADDPKNLYINVRQFIGYCTSSGFIPVNLTNKHIAAVETLTLHENSPKHKDPFDRLLIAQAKCENMLFLTHDSRLKFYDEPCVFTVQ
ncbi:MAG: type II toxin-antitoxin system VapC family toxin [Methanobrevibacter sp.]|nr:type II toxin-antitoxin system VapC family toxin [Methanobrevibacter sp.]